MIKAKPIAQVTVPIVMALMCHTSFFFGCIYNIKQINKQNTSRKPTANFIMKKLEFTANKQMYKYKIRTKVYSRFNINRINICPKISLCYSIFNLVIFFQVPHTTCKDFYTTFKFLILLTIKFFFVKFFFQGVGGGGTIYSK